MKARLASFLLRMLAATWRVRIMGDQPTGPAVVVFWHDEMLAVWYAFRDRHAAALVSASADGDLLAQFLADLHYSVIRGSSSQGGKEALDAMVSAAREQTVLVTPDGPRGPRHVCKPGAFVAAQRAGVPLILCSTHVDRATILHRSWDKFKVPFPFTRITVAFGAPGMIPPTATREQIERVMERTTQHLRALGGDE